MLTKRGRRIVWRMLDQAGVFRSSFNTNAMTMAFAEGSRNQGLRMLAIIHASCPEQYPTMMKEQTDERTNDDGKRLKPPHSRSSSPAPSGIEATAEKLYGGEQKATTTQDSQAADAASASKAAPTDGKTDAPAADTKPQGARRSTSSRRRKVERSTPTSWRRTPRSRAS
jgi:type IV secretory pathway TrbL component